MRWKRNLQTQYTRTVKTRGSQHGLLKVLGKVATPTRVPAGSRADPES